MLTGSGPSTVGVCFDEVQILTVTCTDPARGTFFDVQRAGQPGRRQVLDPGEVFSCRIAAGPADITFGMATDFVFDLERATT